MATIFTFPGKIGDALLQWPVAYQYAKQKGQKITCWLDAGTLKPIERLLASQDVVECVELKPGIQNYTCGGQPWDFGLKTEDFLGHSIYHLGFHAFPERQITLQSVLSSGVQIDLEPLGQEPSIIVPPLDNAPAMRYVVVHGTFQSHMTGVPRFWSFFRDVHKDLEEHFDKIIFSGTPEERQRARELYPDVRYGDFDDGGDFLELARLMAGASLVLGSGSSGVVLGGCLKIPTVRVHDPLGDAPKVIWSNLGPKQWNEPEISLRRLWPNILKEVTGGA
jgi:ADP-heptose:LPS heptosyltransferase